jgi:hypothetical protein
MLRQIRFFPSLLLLCNQQDQALAACRGLLIRFLFFNLNTTTFQMTSTTIYSLLSAHDNTAHITSTEWFARFTIFEFYFLAVR